ncbi:MAG: hypothetical protein EBZ77_04285 [Chitinophagia bacterium]|nr:hypothetical protein [Chitinophagia bacterium]
MTNAYELGFVVMHEGRRYIEVMDEHPMVAGLEYDESTDFGVSVGEPKKDEKEGQSRNMVKRVEVSKVKTKEKTKQKTKKVCYPVLVSGETLFLVPDIETMPVVVETLGERTPIRVPGVQLAELAACKHVKVYHPEGWPRSDEESAELLKKCMSEMNEFKTSTDGAFDNLESILKTIRNYAKELEALINDKSGVTEEKVNEAKKSKELSNLATQIREYKNTATAFKNKHEHCFECVRLLSARFNQADQSSECVQAYCDEAMKIVDRISNNNIVFNENIKLNSSLEVIKQKLDAFVSLGAVQRDETKRNIQCKINELRVQCKGEKQSIHVEVEAYNAAYRNLWSCMGPDLNTTQVPQGADMVVAVQVSGELFRIVHFTRGKQEENQSKREKEKREKEEEEAEAAAKRKYEDTKYAKERRKGEDGKPKHAEHKDVVALNADYDDYLECVSAAKKYIRECGIVNATRTWSSVAWMLTKGPCNEARGADETGKTERVDETDDADEAARAGEESMANSFEALEDPGGLELVLVPLSVFGHLYEKEKAETKYTDTMEIYPNGIWVTPDDPNKSGETRCTTCAACEKDHAKNKGKSGLSVRYCKDERNVIRGLAKRFCADCPQKIEPLKS